MAEPAVRHPENRDVSPRGMLIFSACFVLFIAASMVLLGVIFDTAALWPTGGRAERGNDVSPALQRAPAADLARHRAREEKALHTLAWVDRKAGIARIPIEDAMRMIAAHGLPEWGGGATASAEGECAFLNANVPRTPQAQKCSDAGGGEGAQ